jgi:GAF domain-containing protein
MHNFDLPSLGTKKENYKVLIKQIESLIEGEANMVAIMANISAAINETFNFLWVGFYLVKNNKLILGPFQGPVACFSINKNEGVCGASWEQKKTIIVPDVNRFPGHIACSNYSKSEIVLPIFKNKKTFGLLDIDSSTKNTFDQIDKKYLEKIIKLMELKLI